MHQYFALLGLQEDAGPEEIRAAYARWVKKYKAEDYADDPEYVHRKLAELKHAYEMALQAAGSGGSRFDRRGDFDLPETPRRAEDESAPGRMHMGRDTRRAEREDTERRIWPRRTEKRQRGETRRQRSETDTEVRKTVHRSAASVRAAEIARETSDESETPRRIDRTSSRRTQRDTVRHIPQSADDTGARLGGGPDGTRQFFSVNRRRGSRKRMGLAIAFAIVLLMGVVPSIMVDLRDGDDNPSFDGDGNYSYSFIYETDREDAVFDTAMDAMSYLYEGELDPDFAIIRMDEETEMETGGEELETSADRFAQQYLDREHLTDVTDDLFDTYGEFMKTASDPLPEQVTEVLAFYGFDRPRNILGYVNPYTGETITTMAQYLNYLNRYYEECGLTNWDS